jgi:endonuclease/exonuclease/phosphatase (EEP) superfamily protein YafD
MNQIATTILNVGHLAARLGTLAALALTTASFMDFWVYGEQAASLRPYYAAATLAAVIWFAIFRRPKWGALSLLLVAVSFLGTHHGSGIADNTYRYCFDADNGELPSCSTQKGEHSLRVLTINAYIGSRDQTSLARLAQDTRADLVLVTELDQPLADRLRRSYPYVQTTELKNVYGMGVFSKYPLTDVEIQLEKVFDSPRIHAVVQAPHGPTNLILVNPLPPGTQEAMKARNDLINFVASMMSDSDLPMIVAGDFNTTTWSRHLQPLMKVAKRADSGGTWPSHLPLRIPIDHVFFNGFTPNGVFEFTEDYGTDHVPFLTVLQR